MTREEAINNLESLYNEVYNEDSDGYIYAEAIDMAIEALSADRLTGEWVECESNHIEKIYLCSNCQNYEAWGETEKTPYCPNCGAKMEE